MAEVKWIKLDKDIFHNRKIRQIEKMPDGDALIVIWLKILTLAGDVNDGGLVYFTKDIPYTEELLANEFDRPLNTIRLALEVFQQFGMIEIVNSLIMVSNWEEYQSTDKLSEIREYNRIAKQKSRARQKLLADVNDMSMTSQLSQDTDKDIDKDKDKDIDIDIDIEKRKRFVPPTVDEVRAYCQERQNNVDPERFVDFYSAKGWKIGKDSMKDWKACVRTWERRDGKVGATGVKLADNRDHTLDDIL